jgi:penicillin-binding protein A
MTVRDLVAKYKETLLRIPKKGRVRFALALIIAVALVRIAPALLASSSGASATLPGADTAGAGKKAGLTAGLTLPASAIDAQELASLFLQRPPRLTFSKDTISLHGDSMVVCYSLDTALQTFAMRLLKQYRPRYGALAVINPWSGRVLALVSYRHDSMPDLGGSLFLRSVFPAASVFKTVTAAAAIEKAHFTSETMVPVNGRNHTLYRFQLKKTIAPWSEVKLEDAYALSINPVFGRIGMYSVGKQIFEEYSKRFGFNTSIPFELSVDSSRVSVPDDTCYAMAELASGYNRRTRISPLHGALMASAVAACGAMPCPRLVDSICLIDGRGVYRSEPAVWKTPINEATACELQTMMERVVDNGTCRKTFRVIRRCAWSQELEMGGKTGSMDSDSLGKIDWFIGFASSKDTPQCGLAVGIVTVHGRQWTVHSSYIGSEIFRNFLRPAPKALATKQQSVRASAALAPTVARPKG